MGPTTRLPAPRQGTHHPALVSQALTIAVEHRSDGITVAHFSGEVDARSTCALRRFTHELPEETTGLVLDLRDVQFFGATGLALLVDLAENARTRDRPLALATTDRLVLRPLEATGYIELVAVYPSVDAAAEAVLTAR
jgi:anti-anti-sigma factor